MKKCPFCKAELEENAQFCLYCMKSLEEKTVIREKRKFRWLLIVAGICLLALVLWLLWPKAPAPVTEGSGQPEKAPTTIESTPAEPSDNPVQPTTLPNTTEPKTPIESEPSTVTPNPAEVSKPTEPEITEPPVTEPPATLPEPTEPTEPTEPPSSSIYRYRLAERGDDFSANYTNSGNDIVITCVNVNTGTYDIPSYIDGKRVIAIVANAFSGSGAKIVYVPSTVKTIGNYAFAGCNLTDIYLRGEAIYIAPQAFTGIQTIHSSATCQDRAYNYYKNCADHYGASWEEWNG